MIDFASFTLFFLGKTRKRSRRVQCSNLLGVVHADVRWVAVFGWLECQLLYLVKVLVELRHLLSGAYDFWDHFLLLHLLGWWMVGFSSCNEVFSLDRTVHRARTLRGAGLWLFKNFLILAELRLWYVWFWIWIMLYQLRLLSLFFFQFCIQFKLKFVLLA